MTDIQICARPFEDARVAIQIKKEYFLLDDHHKKIILSSLDNWLEEEKKNIKK